MITVKNASTDTDGIKNIILTITDADGILVASNASGVFTGLTPSTSYRIMESFEALNKKSGLYEPKNTPVLTVTTDAPIDHPGNASIT